MRAREGKKLFGILFYRTHWQGCGVQSTAQIIIIKLTLNGNKKNAYLIKLSFQCNNYILQQKIQKMKRTTQTS